MPQNSAPARLAPANLAFAAAPAVFVLLWTPRALFGTAVCVTGVAPVNWRAADG